MRACHFQSPFEEGSLIGKPSWRRARFFVSPFIVKGERFLDSPLAEGRPFPKALYLSRGRASFEALLEKGSLFPKKGAECRKPQAATGLPELATC